MHDRVEVLLVNYIVRDEIYGQAHVLVVLGRCVEVEVLHVARHKTGTFIRDGAIE